MPANTLFLGVHVNLVCIRLACGERVGETPYSNDGCYPSSANVSRRWSANTIVSLD